MTIELRNVRADFNELVTALQQDLKNKESWRDIFPGATGQTLLEYIAAIGVYQQHSIEQLFLEAFLTTAKRDTSIYIIARMLGIRISRKLSPGINVQFARSTALQPYVIPAWTQFSSNEGNFVNVRPIVFDTNQLVVQDELFAGSIQQYQTLSDGTSFQELRISGLRPFSISDQHLEVWVNNQRWRVVTDGLWQYTAADRVVVDSTTGQGNLILLFGDDLYGTSPNTNQPILVRWIDTQGLATKQLGSGVKLNFGNLLS